MAKDNSRNGHGPKLTVVPKELAKVQPTPRPSLIDDVTETPTLDMVAPLNRETLAQYNEEMVIRKAKRIVPRIFKALEKGLDEGDTKKLELAMEAYGLRAKGSGFTVVTNLFNNTQVNNSPEGRSATYFEGILRKLEEREKVPVVIDVGSN